MNLTRLQINVVKMMGKEIKPLQAKLDRLETKEAQFLADSAAAKADLIAGIAKLNQNIIDYTGGYTLNEVIAPESIIPATPENISIDENELAPETDMTEALRNMAGASAEETATASAEDLGLEPGYMESLSVEQSEEISLGQETDSINLSPEVSAIEEDLTPKFWDTPAVK